MVDRKKWSSSSVRSSRRDGCGTSSIAEDTASASSCFQLRKPRSVASLISYTPPSPSTTSPFQLKDASSSNSDSILSAKLLHKHLKAISADLLHELFERERHKERNNAENDGHQLASHTVLSASSSLGRQSADKKLKAPGFSSLSSTSTSALVSSSACSMNNFYKNELPIEVHYGISEDPFCKKKKFFCLKLSGLVYRCLHCLC